MNLNFFLIKTILFEIFDFVDGTSWQISGYVTAYIAIVLSLFNNRIQSTQSRGTGIIFSIL